MNIILSNTSEIPLYQQICEQLRAQIIKGELPGDFCLPPIRSVAKELRISVITVKKAWEELEHDGFIYSIGGKGCFVSQMHADDLDGKRNSLILEKLKKDIEYYQSIGLSMNDLIDLIKHHYCESTQKQLD